MSRSSTRPRDRLGRPLDHDDPRAFPEVPEREQIGAEQAWVEALEYLARDLPFHAHEVFEQRWKCCPANERNCWQALAQWGAALTQAARGNDVGSQRLALRAKERIEGALANDAVPSCVDVTVVRESLAQLA